jgi:hypothetical protein
MTDLVQELRDLALRNSWPLGEFAAREIERLREELDCWKALVVDRISEDAKK